MRNRVLSNVIDYVITNDIKDVNYYEEELIKVINDVDTLSMGPTLGTGFNRLPKGIIWDELSYRLKFDKVAMHLLGNFSDTIDSEDYRSASVMKNEILDRWNITNDDTFWEIGKDYLRKLREGIERSNILGYLLDSVSNIEQLWISDRMLHLHYIIEELGIILDNITSHPVNDIANESLDYIRADDYYEHPLIWIEGTIEYFKLLVCDRE